MDFYIVSKSDDPQTAASEGAVYVGDDYDIALEKCKDDWFLHYVAVLRTDKVNITPTVKIHKIYD